jgi:hypothetical protein
MTALGSFASPKRRLRRAKEHLNNIKSRLGSYYAMNPYTKLVERNAEGLDEYKIRLTVDLPEVITDLTYEALEALRSALDQATYTIAALSQVDRPDLIHFPVANTPGDFENVIKGRLKGLPDHLVRLFRSFECYETGNRTIWALNQVRRQGAHRLIVPVCTDTGGITVDNLILGSTTYAAVPAPKWDSVKNEMIYLILGPGSEANYNFKFTLFVAFGEVEGLAGQSVPDYLAAATVEVERIMLAIENAAISHGLTIQDG